ncbi:MAG: GIY-YIG nuclease family protein [Patescibacteria group bacterium]|jgi:predicted GIY-YIG superfamily endonuclease
MYYIYSLKCKDGYYVGCTADLKERIARHRKGFVPATKGRLPVELSFYIGVRDKKTAFILEKYFKSGSGRAFITKHLV